MRALGRTAGASLYSTMGAMGVLPATNAQALLPRLPANDGLRVTIVILGAEIAGITAAYQLRKAGYHCMILEARECAGGRVWTLRGGDRIEEMNSFQLVNWDHQRHLYFDAGAAWISQHHAGILGYCREFNVPLEIFVSDNRAALLQTDNAFGGVPQPLRRVIVDGRGGIAALAAKATRSSNHDLRTFLAAVWSASARPDLRRDRVGRISNTTGWRSATGKAL